MRSFSLKKRLSALALLTISGITIGNESSFAGDLRDAAPASSFMAVYSKDNPERDYQDQYYADIWKTVKSTKIIERAMQIAQNRMGDNDAEKVAAARDALTKAVAPIQWDKVLHPTETLYAQRMAAPSSDQLLMMAVPDGGAQSLAEGFTNLFELLKGMSNGQITTTTVDASGVQMTALQFPGQVPFAPAIGVDGDVFIITTSVEFATEGIDLYHHPEKVSKFDDERLVAALKQLPTAEDSLIFYDGQAMASQLGSYIDFIKNVSNGDPNATRVTQLMEQVFAEMSAHDFEITVGYTEGFENRTASLGHMKSGSEASLMSKMVRNQQPFEDWKRWVPATANGYSLSAGVNMHPAYEWLMEVVPNIFPEAQDGLNQFASIQDQIDVHLDADILQSFTGESVSVSFPGKTPSPFGQSSQSATFMRCTNPERIKELMHRGMEMLQQNPQIKSQGIALQPVGGMDGFEELKANFFSMAGIRPVIGFQDGWMIMGTHAEAVTKVLENQSGTGETMADTEMFSKFHLKVDGPVSAISYTNNAESTRAAAGMLQQIGIMGPALIGMVPKNQGGPDLQPLVEVAALLPSVGQIVGKFDFIESTLSVTQAGPDADSYVRNTVTLIRPPAEKKAGSPEKSTSSR